MTGTDLAAPRGRTALVVLLAGSLFLVFRILRPYLDPIVLAGITAVLVHPLFRWLRAKLGGRASLASLLTLLVVLLAVVGPLTLMAISLVNEGLHSAEAIQAWVQAGNLDRLLHEPWAERVAALTNRYFPLIDPQRVDLRALLLGLSQKLGAVLLAKGGAILTSTGALLGQFLLYLFVLFYALRDGEEILAQLRSLSPLRASQEDRLLERVRGVARSALLGAFGTAAAQGITGGVGLAIAGFPAFFWGTVMAFGSLVPVVGTAIVWIPACGYLAVTGRPGMAVFLAIWCGIGVGSIDNFLRPLLMKGAAQMSTLWVFFAILGGMQLFGLPGLVYGPLVFGLCAVLLYLYQMEFQEFLARQKES
ncbi:MAG TPA: AI-2E family transporter [Thermoanaerobaculaceae bacterium]|nr:AI-2E family transporter [Thermoanaerobaculaceae bacterium]HRS16053.1 AI-2E family transporter [Thermoanaerobaculaceae bacterium]